MTAVQWGPGAAGPLLGDRPRSVAWQDRAACRNTPDDLVLFPDTRDASQDEAAAEAAREAYCGACPVRAECLESALASGVSDGVWGGVLFRNHIPRAAEAERRIPARAPADRCGQGHRKMPGQKCRECDHLRYIASKTAREEVAA